MQSAGQSGRGVLVQVVQQSSGPLGAASSRNSTQLVSHQHGPVVQRVSAI